MIFTWLFVVETWFCDLLLQSALGKRTRCDEGKICFGISHEGFCEGLVVGSLLVGVCAVAV